MPKSLRSSVGRDFGVIRKSLSTIAKALSRLGPSLAAVSRGGGAPPSRRGRKLKLSPKRRAVLELQGKYMGHIRGLKPRQKARVKALKAAKGFRAAIALAKKLAEA